MRTKWLLLGFGFLLLASPWRAVPRSQSTEVRDRVGKWTVHPTAFSANMGADERAHVGAWITQLLDIVRRDPALAQPRGFDVNVYPRADVHDLDNQADGPRPQYVGGLLQILLAPFEKGNAGVAANERDATLVVIAVNDLSVFNGWEMGMDGVTKEDAGVHFLKDPPEPFEMRHQLPAYHNWSESESWVLMTRATVPLFTPVTRASYLQSSLDALQKVASRPLAKMDPPPSNDPAVVAAWQEAQRRMAEITQTYQEQTAQMKQQVNGMATQIAAMSPADRRLPVFVASAGPNESGEVEFLGSGGPDIQAIGSRNAALMSDRLPRWTPQILGVSIQGSDRWPELAGQVDQALDWAGFRSLVRAAP